MSHRQNLATSYPPHFPTLEEILKEVDEMQDNTRSLPDAVQVEPRLPFGRGFPGDTFPDWRCCGLHGPERQDHTLQSSCRSIVRLFVDGDDWVRKKCWFDALQGPTSRMTTNASSATAISTRRAMGAGREVVGQRKDGSELAIGSQPEPTVY